MADLANMKVPSFCRYFKKLPIRPFTQFVNEYRITHALKLLAEQPLSITEVCFESGFNNFSYFNRTFKEYIQKALLNTGKNLIILSNSFIRKCWQSLRRDITSEQKCSYIKKPSHHSLKKK